MDEAGKKSLLQGITLTLQQTKRYSAAPFVPVRHVEMKITFIFVVVLFYE